MASPTKKEPDAATVKFHRSPILKKAVSLRYPPSRLNTILSWIVAFLVPSLFYIGPFMLLLPVILYFIISIKAALVSLVINIIFAFYPNKPWPWFRGIFQLWFQWFDFHHNLQVDSADKTSAILSKQESSSLLICAMHPHGIVPIQAFLWMAYCDLYLNKSYGFGAAADVAMRVPLLRQVLCWGSAGSASYSTLHEGLSNGNNLFILPGGVAEMFHQRQEQIVKAKRRGLMKLALQTGACLVPVYVFGGNDFYHQFGFERISRKSQAALILFWGQYGTPLPYPAKCSMVLGDPIVPYGNMGDESITGDNSNKLMARKVPNPTSEQIEELLERYISALERLFHQYKVQAGYPNATLEIR